MNHNFEEFKNWITSGNEIEFSYQGKRYSVTYGRKENGEEYISFCEFYKPDTEFINYNDFMENAKIDGVPLSKICGDVEDIDIF